MKTIGHFFKGIVSPVGNLLEEVISPLYSFSYCTFL